MESPKGHNLKTINKMKKYFIIAAMLLVCGISNAQVTFNGNSLSAPKSTRGAKKDTIITNYKWENTYPIIIRKDTGWCYWWVVSKKTGRPYPVYLSSKDGGVEAEKRIAAEYGITYVEHKKKNK